MIFPCRHHFHGDYNQACSHADKLTDNHPSGDPEPSQCDRNITGRLKEALALVDVNTLDHLVIGSEGIVSFAERGWI
jgi:DNA repair protein RadC